MADILVQKSDDTGNKKNFWLMIVGVLLLLSGVFVLLNPMTALVASAMLIGLVFIILGVGYLMVFRKTDSYMMLVLGILDMIIGVLFLTNLGITAISMPVIFGLWVLFNGIVEIVMGVAMKRDSDPNWKILFWGGVSAVIFSFLIFAYPFIGTFVITLLIGAYLMIYGGLEMVRYFKCC